MKKENPSQDSTFRQKAEEQIKKESSKTSSKPSEGETLKLLHELRVLQIELEMQNEEKEKRISELVIANEQKHERAEELLSTVKELIFQNKEKQKLADELIIANKELIMQNKEKENLKAELTKTINILREHNLYKP